MPTPDEIIQNAMEVAREEAGRIIESVTADLYGDDSEFAKFSSWFSSYLSDHPGHHGRVASLEVAGFFVSVAILEHEGNVGTIPLVIQDALNKYQAGVAGNEVDE